MNVAIDLDATLAAWGPEHARCGDWLPGAAEALHALVAEGHRVVVHTCRATWSAGGGSEEVRRFLRSGGFAVALVREGWSGEEGAEVWERRGAGASTKPLVGIWVGRGKPIAHWYVDDRAVTFNGDWAETLAVLRSREETRAP